MDYGTHRLATLTAALEYEEARGFLAEARLRWRNLGTVEGTDAARQQLDDSGTAIDQRAAVAPVLEQVAAVRTQIGSATGVAEEVYPAAPPSPARGARTFIEHCASCHGQGALVVLLVYAIVVTVRQRERVETEAARGRIHGRVSAGR